MGLQRQAQPRQTTRLGLVALLGLVLVACGPSPEERRQAAERERQQQQAEVAWERCRRDQEAVIRLSDAIQRHDAELAKIGAETYQATRRPEPPDPVLAARFTQADRELDELRYREQLRDWEARERQRYGRWLDEHNSRQEQLRRERDAEATLLRRLAPQLMASEAGSSLKAEALERARGCKPEAFGLDATRVPQAKAAASPSALPKKDP